MKIKNPLDRSCLSISKKDKVLEVGSGHSPSYRANVLVEKYIDYNYHRSDDVKIFPHQTLINVSGENLPFENKEFDYVICCQVLEHAENPEQFIREQNRVSRRGYMEVPSLIGEVLFPKKSHRWVILEIDGKLIIYEKSRILDFTHNFGELFLNFLPYQSIAFRLLTYTHGDLMTIRYEWEDEIDYLINPENEYYKSFFTKPWTHDMIEKIFPRRSFGKEIRYNLKAALHILQVMVSKKRTPIPLSEYSHYYQQEIGKEKMEIKELEQDELVSN